MKRQDTASTAQCLYVGLHVCDLKIGVVMRIPDADIQMVRSRSTIAP
jgi:hypothetical protein